MVDITTEHWEQVMAMGFVDPWNWYHAKMNKKLGGYITSMMTPYGRMIPYPNPHFEEYYKSGVKQYKVKGMWIERNYSATCDPLNKYGDRNVDDFPFVRLMGPSPETAWKNTYYLNSLGQSDYPSIIGTGPPTMPEPKINQVVGAHASADHVQSHTICMFVCSQ